jgi:hypothetical protein
MQKDVVVVYFNALFRCLPRASEGCREHVIPEPGISRIKSRAANHLILSLCNCSRKCFTNSPDIRTPFPHGTTPQHHETKATVAQLVRTFPEIHETRRFTAGHMSLSHSRLIQSEPSHPVYLRSILVLLTSIPRPSKLSLLFRFPYQNSACICPHVRYKPLSS